MWALWKGTVSSAILKNTVVVPGTDNDGIKPDVVHTTLGNVCNDKALIAFYVPLKGPWIWQLRTPLHHTHELHTIHFKVSARLQIDQRKIQNRKNTIITQWICQFWSLQSVKICVTDKNPLTLVNSVTINFKVGAWLQIDQRNIQNRKNTIITQWTGKICLPQSQNLCDWKTSLDPG